MSLIDTYQLATCGQNLTDTFTLASNGILISIKVGGPSPATISAFIPTTAKIEDVREITVVVTIDGTDYTETKVVTDRPSIKASDVKVGVDRSNKVPKITIQI
jgi:hypothetical protein